jgi:transposase
MSQPEVFQEDIRSVRASYLPIASAYCEKIGLGEIIDHQLESKSEVSMGQVVKAMVLDTLAGRSPLYRLAERFEHLDCELLLGEGATAKDLHDVRLGRALDAIAKVGTTKLFSEIGFSAAKVFGLETKYLHWDSTSVSVEGAYDFEKRDDRLNITYGYSKDHRPDLKQFMMHALCTEKNIPLMGGVEDGNSSDKALNNEVLQRMTEVMKQRGIAPQSWIYVADSAFVTEKNLLEIGDNYFVSRLPMNYDECRLAIENACKEGGWADQGAIAELADETGQREAAKYRTQDTYVTIHNKNYRAIVVHSDAYDRRRQKSIDKQLDKSAKAGEKLVKKMSKEVYACRTDAESAARKMVESKLPCHEIKADVIEKPVYARGRPTAGQERKVVRVDYFIEAMVIEHRERVSCMREEAGCFVLITNVPEEGDMAHDAKELLIAYKDQHGIERNFAFLKDPFIFDEVFLKNPHRIEALGLILLTALLIWTLMERSLRNYTKKTGKKIRGWVKRMTSRPTCAMLQRQFQGFSIIISAGRRFLAQPLTEDQLQYLEALGLPPDILVTPPEKCFRIASPTCRM